MPPLSIVHLLAPARYGGLETVVHALTAEQSKQGDRVCAAIVLPPEEADGHPLVAALSDAGVEVELIEVEGRAYRTERRRTKEVLAKHEADVLHTHGYRPDVMDAGVARRMGVPTVTTVHGFTGGGWRNRLYERLQVRAFRRFDAVVAVSEKLRGELVGRGLDVARVHAVPNAWSPEGGVLAREEARDRLGLPQDARIVAWVGRMTPEKGLDVMIRSLASMKQGFDLASVIGAGRAESEGRALAEQLDISERVRWHGAIPNAGRLLGAFDAFAMTSWTEGTPMVLLEAMHAEVPIVTTSVGGIPDVVSADEAHLRKAGAVADIAAALDDVLSNPIAARLRAAAAKQRLITDFAVEPWARRYRAIYDSLRPT